MNKGCPRCGRVIDQTVEVCPHCGYKFTKLQEYYANMSVEKFDKTGKYAGLLKRTIAFLTDFVFIVLLFFFFIFFERTFLNLTLNIYHYFFLFLGILFSYKIISEMIMSKTIGKKIVGIEIINKENKKINFVQALVRNISIILDFITLGIGFLIILFTKNKKGLHDIIAGTVVINSYEKPELDGYVPGIIRLFAFIFDLGLVYAFVYLIEIIFNYVKQFFIINIDVLKVLNFVGIILFFIILVIYFMLSETGTKGSSLGKKILGIRIEKTDGKKMSSLFVFMRFICNLLEVVTLGFLLCLVTNKRQTLKDKIFSTKVIRM